MLVCGFLKAAIKPETNYQEDNGAEASKGYSLAQAFQSTILNFLFRIDHLFLIEASCIFFCVFLCFIAVNYFHDYYSRGISLELKLNCLIST